MTTEATAPAPRRPLRERVSLQTQLVVATLVLAAVAVVSVAGISAWVLRDYLYGRVDATLYASAGRPGDMGPTMPMMDEHRGDHDDDFVPPVEYFAVVVDAGGDVVGSLGPSSGQSLDGALPSLTPEQLEEDTGEPRTISTDGGRDWRVLVLPVTDAAHPTATALVVGVPLEGIQQTVGRLVLVDAVLAVVALAALALLARWVVRASLRPLTDMERTTEQIAAGDLSRRVENDLPTTEVGRLGASFNTMVEQIEESFTAQQASERAARESEEQMRRFVADASHELRTPLTTVRGYAELYRQGGLPDEASVAGAMGRIERTSTRMGALVEELLLLARLDQRRPLERQRLDLRTLVADVVQEMAPVLGDHPLTSSARPGDDALMVEGDAERLRQVVVNLVSNAILHTPDGTEVRVDVERSGPDVVLRVEDAGPGMSPEQVAHAFERFYRGDESRSRRTEAVGSGLGLAIVDALVRAHGGRVTLESSEGVGTVVTVTLPAA